MLEQDNHDSISFPSKADVILKLESLIHGESSREDVASWALQWTLMDNIPRMLDDCVWEALERLSAADMITTDRPYLYGKEDFESWLASLKAEKTKG